MPHADPSEADAGFMKRFDAERARVLRRRIAWYCTVVLAMLGLSLYGTFFGTDEPAAPDSGAAPGTLAVDLMYDLPLVALYAGTLAYMLLARPDRRRLVLAITILTIAAGGFASAMEPIADLLAHAGRAPPGPEAAASAGFMGFLACAVLMSIAFLLVPMSVRESVRIGAPCLVIFAALLLGVIRPPPGASGAQLAMLAAVAGAGAGWSRWRYGEFDARFRAGELRGRLGEMSAELAYARRVHEALFPPPIERGAVRMAYRYEPMREIGGDFLFAHPLAFPPAGESGPLTVVLLDVSGHGVAAALAVNRLHGELRRFFTRPPADAGDDGPGALLAVLNSYAYADLAPQSMFATALCLRADPSGRTIAWASAGHPPAFILRPGGATEELRSTAVMLGVLPPDAFAAGETSAPFAPGDAVVAFTDGAMDAADAAGRPLGLAGIRVAVCGAAPGRALDRLVAAVHAHRSGPAGDDILIVELTPSG